jgi:hypothetical protein
VVIRQWRRRASTTDAPPARNSSVAITTAVDVSVPVTGRVWIPVGGSSAVGGSDTVGGSDPLDPPTVVVGSPGEVVVVLGQGST